MNGTEVTQDYTEQPERVVVDYTDEFNAFIVDVFKNTGIRISMDDPVLAMVVLNETVQKKQTAMLHENFLALSEGFRHVLSSLEEENLQRFKKIVETCGDLDNEIKNAVSAGENELKNASGKIQGDLTQHTLTLFAGIKTDFEKVTSGYQNQIAELKKVAKPLSFKKGIVICALCTALISSAFSAAAWFALSAQKAQDIRMYAGGYMDMKSLTLKTISRLPKVQQDAARAELNALERRSN